MTIEKVSAGAGWQWIGQGFGTVKRQPQVLLVMGLIVGIISVIPILGGLVIFILGPALLGGIVYATRATETGGKPAIGDLMHAFQDNDRTGPMIALCLPMVVGVIIAGIIAAIFFAGAMVSGGISAETIQSNPMVLLHAVGAGAFIAVPLIVIVFLIAQAMTFFAISRVLLDRVEAFAGMKESLQACRRNIGAYLVALLTLVIAQGIFQWILSQLHLHWIGSLITSTIYYAIMGATLYFAYRAVFGNDASATAEVPPAAPIPPPPPPSTSANPPADKPHDPPQAM